MVSTGHVAGGSEPPPWRAIVRRVAEQLIAAGIVYKVVGSTSLALHGVALTPHDVDIETDAGGAYAMQSLWPDAVVEPVALRTSAVYRSHLGRLEIDGMQVEIMGDMERREGDIWVSTAASQVETVDLDGVPVRTSWLEEEALAYVRRGRLERTALCLPHCDQSRLLALLRGEVPTAVI